jgi:hypothetical protein
MARNPATPAALAMTPAIPTGSQCRLRAALIRKAMIRSQTKIGSTSASGPNRSATICKPKPARVAPIAASHSGWRTRSSSSRGDSAARRFTRWVPRCSPTDETPKISEPPRAATTATEGPLIMRGSSAVSCRAA